MLFARGAAWNVSSAKNKLGFAVSDHADAVGAQWHSIEDGRRASVHGLTPLLKHLEAARRVNRSRESTDELQVLITRTEDGRALKAAAAIISAIVLRAAGTNRQSFEQLRADLIRLRRSLDIAI